MRNQKFFNKKVLLNLCLYAQFKAVRCGSERSLVCPQTPISPSIIDFYSAAFWLFGLSAGHALRTGDHDARSRTAANYEDIVTNCDSQ